MQGRPGGLEPPTSPLMLGPGTIRDHGIRSKGARSFVLRLPYTYFVPSNSAKILLSDLDTARDQGVVQVLWNSRWVLTVECVDNTVRIHNQRVTPRPACASSQLDESMLRKDIDPLIPSLRPPLSLKPGTERHIGRIANGNKELVKRTAPQIQIGG